MASILLEWANDVDGDEAPDPVDLVNTCPSTVAPPARRSAHNSFTPEVCMYCALAISGKTPCKGSNTGNLHPKFVERCVKYDDIFPTVKYRT